MATAVEPRPLGGEHFEPRYDLETTETQAIVSSYLENTDVPQGHFIGVEVDTHADIANVARTLEREVFQEAFRTNDAQFMRATYERVEDTSRFFMVLDCEQRQGAGVMRIADRGPYLTLDDAPQYIGQTPEEVRRYHGINPGDKLWDVLTLAIGNEYRARKSAAQQRQTITVNGMLYRTFIKKGQADGAQHAVAMIDTKAHHTLQNIGVPFQPMHGHTDPFSYYDSPSTVALYCPFDDFVRGMSAHYRGYHASLQQIRDYARVAYGSMGGKRANADPASEDKKREAMKRIGLGRLAGIVATGKHVDAYIAA